MEGFLKSRHRKGHAVPSDENSTDDGENRNCPEGATGGSEGLRGVLDLRGRRGDVKTDSPELLGELRNVLLL